jgi:hypothetical protein
MRNPAVGPTWGTGFTVTWAAPTSKLPSWTSMNSIFPDNSVRWTGK